MEHILEKEVELTLALPNRAYYNERGYNFPFELIASKQKVRIKTADLQKGSNVKVTRKCAGCGEERRLPFCRALKSPHCKRCKSQTDEYRKNVSHAAKFGKFIEIAPDQEVEESCKICSKMPIHSKGFCKSCYSKNFFAKNKDNPEFVTKRRASQKAWAERNKEKLREKRAKYAEENREKRIEWRAKNREKLRARVKKWRKENPDAYKRQKMSRLHTLILQTPKWVDLKAIEDIYVNCPPGMTVDHIIPLKGKDVSGLHVPWNLQYLPGIENSKKSNKIKL